MKHKLKSRFVEEISITSGMQMAPSLWQKAILKLLKSLLMRVKEQSEKAGLKLIIQNTKLMASGPITSWQKMGKQWKQRDFIFLGSKITVNSDCSHEIKRCLLLGRKAMANLDSVIKSRDFTLPTKVCRVKIKVYL